jgi:inward rectifier potassium channel
MDGIPTLMIRVGNERRNQIVGATFRATLMRTTRTAEGVTVYRTDDLALTRDRAPALNRSWMILHHLGPTSPLHGQTPESLAACDAELTLAVAGTDDTSLQPVHAQHTWLHHEIVWGARLADVISETAEGDLLLDLRRFHELTSTEPSEAFPYGAALVDRQA